MRLVVSILLILIACLLFYAVRRTSKEHSLVPHPTNASNATSPKEAVNFSEPAHESSPLEKIAISLPVDDSNTELEEAVRSEYEKIVEYISKDNSQHIRLLALITQLHQARGIAHEVARTNQESPRVMALAVSDAEHEVLKEIEEEFGRETRNLVEASIDAKHFIREVSTTIPAWLSAHGEKLRPDQSLQLLFEMRKTYITPPARRSPTYVGKLNAESGLTNSDYQLLQSLSTSTYWTGAQINLLRQYLIHKNTPIKK